MAEPNSEQIRLFNELHDRKLKHWEVFSEEEYAGIWTSIVDKYPESAHFVYELVQNADDAEATTVSIILKRDCLIVSHNGKKHFDVSAKGQKPIGDINAITGVGFSSKINQENSHQNKIGKFGVGFKAVFQYTDVPHIYDDIFKFKIVNYIVPERLYSDYPDRKEGETLFYFPFKNPRNAYLDISDRLKKLENPILFLNHIKEVVWRDETIDNKNHIFSKNSIVEKISNGIKCERVELNNANKIIKLLLFSTDVQLQEKGKHTISIGYYLTEQGFIDSKKKTKVYCFFPTSESLDLPIICHAPFLLTDSRQNIKQTETINDKLWKQLASLHASSLLFLRDMKVGNRNLLDDNIFDIIPLSCNYDDEPIDCFYEECCDIIQREPLLKREFSSGYAMPKEAYVCTNARRMFPFFKDKQIQTMCGDNKVCFLSEAIGARSFKNSEIQDLLEEIGAHLYGPDDLVDVDEDFMRQQTHEWVVLFYKFLEKNESKLWDKDSVPKGQTPPLWETPIIKCEDGIWRAPYNGNELNVFFTFSSCDDDYNYVASEYANDLECRSFLEKLGIKQPNKLDYIKKILSKYSDDEYEFQPNELDNDLETIISYHRELSDFQEQNNFIKLIKDDLLVRDTHGYMSYPSGLYDESDSALVEYVKITECSCFIDYNCYKSTIRKFGKERVREFFVELGLFTEITMIRKTINNIYGLLPQQQEELKKISYTHLSNITDYLLDGLSELLKKQDKLSYYSRIIWKKLNQIEVSDFTHARIQYFYYSSSNKYITSNWLSLLKDAPWLLNGKKPCEVTREELLSAGYVDSDELCEIFDIKTSRKTLEELGASTVQIENEELGEIVRQSGITKEQLIELITQYKQSNEEFQTTGLDDYENYTSDKDDTSTSDFPPSLSRDEMRKVGANEMFKGKEPSHKKDKDKPLPITEENLEETKRKIEEEFSKKNEVAELRLLAEQSEKYSKEWFEALLELEYRGGSKETDNYVGKTINISFGKVTKESGSDSIYLLENPSRPIPLWIEEIGDIQIVFKFRNFTECTFVFDVASVRDFTLRLKSKNSDINALSKLDWKECTEAHLSLKDQIQLVGKLKTAFQGLSLPNGFNLKDNLTDNIEFIFGPPGTGKTTRLAEIIINKMSYSGNNRILVLAPTNTACDEIANKIIDKYKGVPEWLCRFVASGDERLQYIVADRDSLIYSHDKACIISTIARLPFDGFNGENGYHKLMNIDWDLVICDEASMIPIADITFAIYNFKDKKILIAGDPMQITPIVSEDGWKNENIYTMVNLDRFDNPHTEPIQFKIENLGKQYRSLPPIGEMFSKYSYNDKLKHHRSMTLAKSYSFGDLELNRINFISFKVDKYDSIFGSKKLNGSHVHVYSVLLVYELTKYIAKKYAGESNDEFSIGIICPYASQAQMINSLINQISDLPSNITVNVGTIHRFQGGQCNMILALFNPPKGLANYADRIFLNRQNIVNVAISRAQDYLCMLVPHCDTEGYENLYELNKVGRIALEEPNYVNTYTCDQIEEIVFGRKFYIENNSFVTSHQMTNVYTKATKKYEIRIDENAVDMQIM